MGESPFFKLCGSCSVSWRCKLTATYVPPYVQLILVCSLQVMYLWWLAGADETRYAPVRGTQSKDGSFSDRVRKGSRGVSSLAPLKTHAKSPATAASRTCL